LAGPYLNTNEGLDFATRGQSLHEVISHGTKEEITNLLSSGISANIRNTLNNTPLHTAIPRGDIGIVKSLLNYGANVDAIGFMGKTPLHLAVGSKAIIKLLLKHQPTLSIPDDEGNTVLHYMLSIEDWWLDAEVRTIMETMLSNGANVNITNKTGESPLYRLVADITPPSYFPNPLLDMLLNFLKHQPDVKSPLRNGSALLAVFLDNSSILSNSGPEIGFQCLEQFLIAGADGNTIIHSRPLLHYYLKFGRFARDSRWTHGHWKRVLTLLIQRSNLEVADPDGNYPLHIVLSRRNFSSDENFSIPEITAMLISRNVNLNQINHAGASPLEIWLKSAWYYRANFLKVTLLLIKAGAATIILTTTGQTLFDLVNGLLEKHRTPLMKALLEGDMNSGLNDADTAPRPEWAGAWRLAYTEPLWNHAKSRLVELEHSPSRPKGKDFNECAFVVVAERLLEKHKAQLKLWQRGELAKGTVEVDYEHYYAILRDCRDRNAEVDPSWYTYLLDLMDFHRDLS
jgi:ankyrin repeat protein